MRIFALMVFSLYSCLLGACEPYLILLVNSRDLNYSNAKSFFRSVAKHPSDGTRNRDVGHAWIYFAGPEGVFEGGHSGETGLYQPKYFDGVVENAMIGAENPIRYLFEEQCDGYLEKGSGGHRPTCAAALKITLEQYNQLQQFVQSYNYSSYSITQKQCCHFVVKAAKIAGIELECDQIINVDKQVCLEDETYVLWSDPKYSVLQVGSPERLQREIKRAIASGQACDALAWFRNSKRDCPCQHPLRAGRCPHKQLFQ